MSTNAEILVKISPVLAEIFSGIWRFLPSRPKRCSYCPLNLWGYWIIFLKFAQVDKIFPLNIFESEWRYCNPFWNAAEPNVRMDPNFALKFARFSCRDRCVSTLTASENTSPPG